MAHIDTSLPVSAGGNGGGFFGGVGELLGGGLAAFLAAREGGGGSLPGGAPMFLQQPGGGGFFGNFDFPGVDFTPQGSSATLAGITEPFRRTSAGASAQPHLRVNPVNGRQEWFRPAGRPVLFSKDMGICRKVEKLAKRAAKSTRSRRRGRR